jgi:hypothetical protein
MNTDSLDIKHKELTEKMKIIYEVDKILGIALYRQSALFKIGFAKAIFLSFSRRRESRMPLKEAWIPAFAGMTTG